MSQLDQLRRSFGGQTSVEKPPADTNMATETNAQEEDRRKQELKKKEEEIFPTPREDNINNQALKMY